MRLVTVLVCIAAVLSCAWAEDVVCKRRTKTSVQVGDGESFSFKTQGGREYKPKSRCIVKYKKSSSCPTMRFSCSKFSLKARNPSCTKGDKMLVFMDGKAKRFCQGNPPNMTSSGDMKIVFISNRASQSSGAECSVECVSGQDGTPGNTVVSRAPLNPERGFMVQTKSRSSNYQPLTVEQLVGYRDGQNVTCIQRIVVLDSFLSTPLSSEFLSVLLLDFVAADEAGFTMILRFHYNDNDNGSWPPDTMDADIDIAEGHLEQLAILLEEWQHVILTVEAGFIGTWGEWYYSENYNDPSNGYIPTAAQIVKRRRLVQALLSAFPLRHIVLRTPAHVQTALEDNDPLTEDEAFGGSDKSRIGMHNDCFLASDSDYGTFQSEADRLWLEKQSNFTFVGGETCALNSPRTDCPAAWVDIQRYHWTYLSESYNKDVLDPWKEEGCYDQIADHLGYRLVIDHEKSVFPVAVAANSTYQAIISIENRGVGRVINNKTVKLILKRDGEEKEFCVTDPSADFRKVGAGETIDLLIEADLSNIEVGDYTVALIVEGKGSSNWTRIVMEPYEENVDRWNFLPGLVIQGN